MPLYDSQPWDNSGRISKKAFLISNLTLFIFCLISACARFYIRIRVQKQFSADDGLLLFGIGCLICAMGLLFTFADRMYLVGAIESETQEIRLPSNFTEQAFDFQKLCTVALILTWCAIVSVKFSYLLLFKKLIDRLRPMIIYWWCVAVFNALISAYGAAVYVAACPTFYNTKALQCVFGAGVTRSIAYSISQMVLDITGDLLILYIPCRLIWTIKIRRTQKIALSLCLCLTILTIVCTITRISGIHTGRTVPSIDSVWGTYWQFIAANIALTMTAATAFRTFFVSRASNKAPQSPRSKYSWILKGERLLRSIFTPQSRRSKQSDDSSGPNSKSDGPFELRRHQIPRGTMTGIRTFICGQEKTTVGNSEMMHSMIEEGEEDSRPFSIENMNSRVINVQQDIRVRSDNIC